MEETVFHLGGVDLAATGSDVRIWDLQLWSVFQIRFHKAQSKGEEVFASLGALGKGLNLHNATNDYIAQWLALMRVLSMEESEWTSWFVDYTDLSPMTMDWVKASIYRENFNMRPRTLHEHTGPSQGNRAYRSKVQGRQHSNMQATTSKSNIQATTRKSNTQATTSKSHAQAATSTKPAHAMDFRNGSAKGQNEKKTKGEENVAAGTENSEVSKWWNGYDKKKVSSVMSKYRKPTIAAASKSEEVASGWPADMHWPY